MNIAPKETQALFYVQATGRIVQLVIRQHVYHAADYMNLKTESAVQIVQYGMNNVKLAPDQAAAHVMLDIRYREQDARNVWMTNIALKEQVQVLLNAGSIGHIAKHVISQPV